MPGEVRDGESWKPIQDMWVRDGESWKSITDAWVRDAESWKPWFSTGLSAPSGLTATTVDDSQIDLNWTNEDTYDDVEVYRDSSLIATLSGTATSHSDTGLDPNTQYCYTVKGCTTADGCSTNSNEDCATTDSIAGPSSLSAVKGTPSETEIDLSWTNNDTYDDIEVFRDSSLIDTIAGSSTTYTDDALDQGTQYCYEVRGVVGSSPTAFSNEDCATTDSVSAITNLSATTIDNNQIDLSWDNNDTYDSINVLRDGGNIATIGGSNESYSDTIVDSGTQYCYEVEGCISGSCAAPSNEDCATTTIPAPSSLNATAGDGQVQLTWTNEANDYQNVEVHRCEGSGCSSFSLLTTKSGSSESHTDTSVTNGTSYTYKVRAVGGDINSSFSNEDSATPQSPQPESLHPNTDASASGWSDAIGGDSDGSLWDEVDEATADDTSTYISLNATSCNSNNGSVFLGLDNSTEAHGSSQTHRIHVRTRFSSGGGSASLTVELHDPANGNIASFSATLTEDTWVTTTHDLTTSEIDNISDYDGLEIHLDGQVNSTCVSDCGTQFEQCSTERIDVTQTFLDIF